MNSWTPEKIAVANSDLRNKSAFEIVRWASARAKGRAIVSTNFRPYEAVILHLATQGQTDIPVLWADHGYNRPATYQHAEQLKKLLKLNLKAYVPKMTAAHYDAIHGGAPAPVLVSPSPPSKPPPSPAGSFGERGGEGGEGRIQLENEERIKEFSAVMKLEPFQRGMKELAPTIWLTALRKVQNPNRAGLDIISEDRNFGTLKVSPLFYWSDADMENYLKEYNLPNEWDYFDPAKADEKRECGLHASWGADAVVSAGAGI